MSEHRDDRRHGTHPPHDALEDERITVAAGRPIPQRVADELRRTRRWTQYGATLLFVGAGISALGGLAFVVVVAVAGRSASGVDLGITRALSALIPLAMWSVAAVAGLLGTYLHRFSHSARAAASHRIAVDLERALGHLRRFWRLAVVVAGTGIVLGILGGILGAVAFVVLLRGY